MDRGYLLRKRIKFAFWIVLLCYLALVGRLLYLQDEGGDENWRLFAVDVASGQARDLTPFPGVQVQVIGTSPLRPDEALDFFAGQLACRMAQRVRAGLHRGYRERRESGPALRGRLDVAAQLREGVTAIVMRLRELGPHMR